MREMRKALIRRYRDTFSRKREKAHPPVCPQFPRPLAGEGGAKRRVRVAPEVPFD